MRAWMLTTVLFPAIPAVVASGDGNTPSIRLWPNATVVEERITLVDLCDLTGFDVETEARLAAIPVASSPPAGGSFSVTLQQVREAVTAVGINVANISFRGASRCGVTRPTAGEPTNEPATGRSTSESTPKPGSQGRTLRQVIETWFLDRAGLAIGRVELQFGGGATPSLNLEEPEFQFDIRSSSEQAAGLIRLEVDVLRDGIKIQTVPLAVEVSFVIPVVTTRRPINVGAPVRNEDVGLEERIFSRPETSGLTDVDAIIGKRARRFIPADTMLTGAELETVPLVLRGQLVEVSSSQGGITVTTAARAMGDGGYGDTIELRTLDKRREPITGVVIGAGRVELKSFDGVSAGVLVYGGAGKESYSR